MIWRLRPRLHARVSVGEVATPSHIEDRLRLAADRSERLPVILDGLDVDGPVVARDIYLDAHLELAGCRLRVLDLRGLRAPSLTLRNCVVDDRIDLSEAQITGRVELIECTSASVSLVNARVEGDMVAALSFVPAPTERATSRPGLDADSLGVGGNLRLAVRPLRQDHGGKQVGAAVRLRGARIALECSVEGWIDGVDRGGRSLYLGQADVGDAVVIQVEAIGSLDLAMGSFGSVWMTHGASFMNDRTSVPEATFFSSGPSSGVALTMKSTQVKGDVNLSGATFRGPVVLDDASIGGDAVLRADDSGKDLELLPRLDAAGGAHVVVSARSLTVNGSLLWYPTCSVGRGWIDFRGATVRSLDDRPQNLPSYTRLGSDAPSGHDESLPFWQSALPVRLDGFRYSTLVGVSGESLDQESVASWLERRLLWIRSAWTTSHDAYSVRGLRSGLFSTTPYLQLAGILDGAGYQAAARDVLFAMRQDAMTFGPRLPRTEHMVLTFLRYFVGWGYRPMRALIWAVAAIVVGTVVFDLMWHQGLLVAESPSTTAFQPLVVSLDTFIPGMLLGTQESYRIETSSVTGWLGLAYLYLHHLTGWAVGIGLAYSSIDRLRGER